MTDGQNTFFLFNPGAQSGLSVGSARNSVGSITTGEGRVGGSGAAFSALLAGQVQNEVRGHPGLQKAIAALTRILEGGVIGNGSSGRALAVATDERQVLPQGGNFLPGAMSSSSLENARQRLLQLLDTLSEAGSALPEPARQKIQRLLSGLDGLPIPDQALSQLQQRLQQLLDRSSETGSGLATQAPDKELLQNLSVPLSEKANEQLSEPSLQQLLHDLQELLDKSAQGAQALPEQARQRLQQLVDRSEADQGVSGILPERALEQLQGLLDRSGSRAANLSEIASEKIRQQIHELSEIFEAGEVAALGNPLAEAIRSIITELQTATPVGKASEAAAVSVVADAMKSSRSMNPGAVAESTEDSISARMFAIRAQSLLAVSAEKANTNSVFDKAGLLARSGADQQSVVMPRINAISPVVEKIIEQVPVNVTQLNGSQTSNVQQLQGVESRDISAMLSGLNATHKTGTDVQSPLMQDKLDLPQSLYNKNWGQELGNRVVWMTKQQIQVANIRVNPPHLGPIEVRVSVQNDTTNVSFISQHAVVRDVIESSIPRLREMLGENGLNLANADVADQSSSREQQRQMQSENEFLSFSGESSAQVPDELESEVSDEVMNAAVSMQGEGLIDYYV